MDEIDKIYSKVFSSNANYNGLEDTKIELVDKWIKNNKFKTILDVGCGRGHYLKNLKYKITGIEPSKYLCDNDLKGLKVINSDILSYKEKYEGLYCMDVLEHISHEDIHKVVEHLSKLAPKALIGIASHSDKHDNIELHLIIENSNWWMDLLQSYYTEVKLVEDWGNFFVFEVVCSQ